MNVKILIVEGDFPEGDDSPLSNWKPDDWFPWINCKSMHETMHMAAHKHLRLRGCIGKPIQLHVFAYEPRGEDKPKYLVVTSFTAEARREPVG